jgi:hypothetical protein
VCSADEQEALSRSGSQSRKSVYRLREFSRKT